MDVDLIERCEALERELRIQKEQFRGVFESSSIGMAIVGLQGKWIKVNGSLLKILGYDRERLYQLNFQDITHPDDLNEDLILLKSLISGKIESYQLEKRYFNSNGNIIWGLLSVSIVRDAKGLPLHFVSQILDITDAKKLTHLRLTEMDKKINRIAYELHENIAQTLASIKLFLASSRAKRIYEGTDLMGIDQKLTSLISDIQFLTDQIVPSTFIEENLHSLINGLVVKYAIAHDIKINLTLDEFVKTLTFPSTYNLFRIIEDQIDSAVLRNASSVAIKLKKLKSLTISFNDDGRIETNSSNPKLDLLISNIKTRVEMLGGVIKNPGDIYSRNMYSIAIPLPRSGKSY
ncbi:MAG: PAS domain S-box protein [Chitinophagaceae bacterium]|nr:PAS domain S-box protein [Chitinophagaceae bacterium]